MQTKKSKKNVRVVNEMPTFKRTTRVGISKAKIEKKKMHTNTKPVVKKEKPKSVNKNFKNRIKQGVWKLMDYHMEFTRRLNRLGQALERYAKSNNKENTKSVIYNADLIINMCDRYQHTLNVMKDNCNKIKEAVTKEQN